MIGRVLWAFFIFFTGGIFYFFLSDLIPTKSEAARIDKQVQVRMRDSGISTYASVTGKTDKEIDLNLQKHETQLHLELTHTVEGQEYKNLVRFLGLRSQFDRYNIGDKIEIKYLPESPQTIAVPSLETSVRHSSVELIMYSILGLAAAAGLIFLFYTRVIFPQEVGNPNLQANEKIH